MTLAVGIAVGFGALAVGRWRGDLGRWALAAPLLLATAAFVIELLRGPARLQRSVDEATRALRQTEAALRALPALSAVASGHRGVAGAIVRHGDSSVVVPLDDISPQQRAEQLLADQAVVLDRISRGTSLVDVSGSIVEILERQLPVRAVLHGVDQERMIRHLAGLEDVPAVRAALSDGVVSPTTGPLGPVAHHGQAALINDIADDLMWDGVRQPTAEAGFSSAWCLPVSGPAKPGVRGVLTLLYSRGDQPADDHVAVVEIARHLAGVAMERQAVQVALGAGLDSLTDLPSRTVFLDRITNALNRSELRGTTLAIILLDIDRFQVINDSLGHDTGDIVLSTVAGRLATILRPGDSVARFGGDEFIVLCEGVEHAGDVERIAARLAEAVRLPIIIDDDDVVVTASMGVALADDLEPAPPQVRTLALLRDADAALAVAKAKGRDRHVLFAPSIRAQALARMDSEKQLRQAVQRGELGVAYQPVVDLETGHITGVEALARWNHPQRGPVSPSEFIPIAEETGLIEPIGEFVLRESLRRFAGWRRRIPGGEHLTLSVNLSARQLSHPECAMRIRQALAEHEIPAAALCLEITESLLVEDSDQVRSSLGRLKDLGVRLAVDDFGTGYSSLTYLRRFPVDVLKIDWSFVRGLGRTTQDDAIVAAVVELAHALSLVVVAEGVEDPAQLRALMALGCEAAQGFLLGRPEPAEALEARLIRFATMAASGPLELPRAPADQDRGDDEDAAVVGGSGSVDAG